MIRWIARLLISTIAAFVFASVSHSQFVLLGLENIGVSIPLSEKIAMTLGDVIGLLPGYGSVMLVTLAIGYVLINVVHTRWFTLPNWRYPLAGFVAMATALTAMQPLLDVTLIAGARSSLGFLFQCLAGAVGGLLFALLPSASPVKNEER